jgi:hypothetical protein
MKYAHSEVLRNTLETAKGALFNVHSLFRQKRYTKLDRVEESGRVDVLRDVVDASLALSITPTVLVRSKFGRG